MDCMGCECTEKSMKRLECAIDNLLKKGRQVNKMMDNEKGNIQNYKKKEVDDLKYYSQQIDETTDTSPSYCDFPPAEYFAYNVPVKKRTIHNKLTGEQDTIDFDIPSLPTETSGKTSQISQSYKQEKPSCVMSSSYVTTVSETIDTCQVKATKLVPVETQKVHPKSSKTKKNVCTVRKESYVVDRGMKPENLPSEVLIEHFNDGFKACYKFLETDGKETMSVEFRMRNGEIQDVKVDEKLIAPL